jgi:nicotinamidase-related amidase
VEKSGPQFTNGNVCKKGAKGTGIAKKVIIVNEKIYSKSKMSAFSNEQLCLFLKENGISELYITGLLAEACIKSTAIAAIKNNYDAIIVEDAVGSANVKRKLVALLYCERKGANIVTAQKLLNQFTPGTIYNSSNTILE